MVYHFLIYEITYYIFLMNIFWRNFFFAHDDEVLWSCFPWQYDYGLKICCCTTMKWRIPCLILIRTFRNLCNMWAEKLSCHSLDGGTMVFSGQFMQRIFRSTREFFPVRVGLIKAPFFCVLTVSHLYWCTILKDCKDHIELGGGIHRLPCVLLSVNFLF